MKLIDGKFYEGDKEVPLEFGNRKQIDLLRIAEEEAKKTAEEAKAMGFVSRLVPQEDLDTAIDELVQKLCSTGPQSVALGRTAFYAAVNHDLDSRVRMLQAHLSVALMMPDADEGLAAFAEKRKPDWSH